MGVAESGRDELGAHGLLPRAQCARRRNRPSTDCLQALHRKVEYRIEYLRVGNDDSMRKLEWVYHTYNGFGNKYWVSRIVLRLLVGINRITEHQRPGLQCASFRIKPLTANSQPPEHARRPYS